MLAAWLLSSGSYSMKDAERGLFALSVCKMNIWMGRLTRSQNCAHDPGSHLKIDSAFYPSEVGKMRGERHTICSLHN